MRRSSANNHLAAKAIRFIMVGASTGLIYVIVTAVLVSGLEVSPGLASMTGYWAAMPMSFLGHRQISFRSNGHWVAEVTRFAAMQMLNMAIAALAMHGAVSWFGGAYWWGMLAIVILVPLSNFTLSNLWVFRHQTGRTEREY